MPYINKDKRIKLNKIVNLMVELEVKTDGELNYILFAYCRRTTRLKYNDIKNYIGELEECATEIRRRILAPHEDRKIIENGDI